MLNLHFTVSVENFHDGDKPIDRGAIRAAVLKSLRGAGHSADAAQINGWNEQPLPPAPLKTA